MFAVPGWSLSANSLKTETSSSNAISSGKRQPSGLAPEPPKGRKRSRDNSQRPSVTSENFGALWERVIEGKEPPVRKSNGTSNLSTSERKRRKKTKEENDEKRNDGDTSSSKADSSGPTGQHKPLVSDPSSRHELQSSKARYDRRKLDKEGQQASKARRQANGELPPKRSSLSGQTAVEPTKPITVQSIDAGVQLTPLQASMRQKLTSSRFRYLNQTLYTTPSADSFSLFDENPEMFEEYHEGFRRQIKVWPENPVESYIRTLQARGKLGAPGKRVLENVENPATGDERPNMMLTPLPRTNGWCTAVDLGCGDAKISQEMAGSKRKLKLEIKSYDLQSPNSFVTRAYIAKLPLKDGTVDIAIFCLALMGTNWVDFIEEAFRILRWKGELWVAEIKSRFGRIQKGRVDHSVGNKKKPVKGNAKQVEEEAFEADLAVEVDGQVPNKQDTDVSAFVEVLRLRGFVLQAGGNGVDLSNKMFVKLNFQKALTPVKGKGVPIRQEGAARAVGKLKKKFVEEDKEEINEGAVLKPCVYKLR